MVVMGEIDPSTIVPTVIIGPILIVAGVLTIMFRESLYRAIVRQEKVLFGKAGQALASHQSSVGAITAGACAIAIGLLSIGLAITGIVQAAT